MPSALRASARPAFCAGPPPFCTSTALVRSLFCAPPYPYSTEPVRLAFLCVLLLLLLFVWQALSFVLLIIFSCLANMSNSVSQRSLMLCNAAFTSTKHVLFPCVVDELPLLCWLPFSVRPCALIMVARATGQGDRVPFSDSVNNTGISYICCLSSGWLVGDIAHAYSRSR